MARENEPEKSSFLQKMEQKTQENIERLRRLDLSYDDVLRLAASTMVSESELAQDNEALVEMLNDYSRLLGIFSEQIKDHSYDLNVAVIGMMAEADSSAAKKLLAGMELAKNSQSRKGAKARHAETYALRAEVIAYWSEHIDASLSADKAAAILAKHFPLSHRTLSEYVAAEKKIRRASKA